MIRPLQALAFVTIVILGAPLAAAAQERLCDTQYEDCRAPLLQLIRNEQALLATTPPSSLGIDVAFWFMEDSRYVTALINAHNAGVPVRVLVDPRAQNSHPRNQAMLDLLRDGGIPMRDKFGGGILHFKMMLFHGQNVVEFSKANYTPFSFVPAAPNVDYIDEAIFFTDDINLTNSFRRRFEDLWTDPARSRDYANNATPPERRYEIFPIHPSMNFPPLQDFALRSISRFKAEPQRVDAIVFRATDDRMTDAVVKTVARGIPVRVITESSEYRNPDKFWHSKHIDLMYMGGAQVKHRQHQGLLHQASVVLHGLGEVIFGSSNWTTASAFSQDEHNYFYHPGLGKPWFFQWFADQFEAKWNDTANYVPFQPLPPGTPTYSAPLNLASGVGSSVTLKWDGGTWAHLYDIYFGTTPEPPLAATNLKLGSPAAGIKETYTVRDLLPGTTYYWRIVGKTWAQLGKNGPIWSFTTAGTPPGGSGLGPYGGIRAPLPGIFEAENFDEGGQSIAYHDVTVGNSGGAYRPTDVDLQPTTDTGGGYNVGWTKAGEWLKYSVTVAASAAYQFEARVAMIGAGATLRVEVDGVDAFGPIAVPNTGAWNIWQTITTAAVPLTAGDHVIRVLFATATSSGAVGNYNWFRFVGSTSSSGTTPYGGTPVPLPGIVQVENYDIGGQGLAFHDTTAGNSGGAHRSDNVDIGPTNDPSSGGYYVGWTRAGEWLKYTVNVTETRDYTLHVRVANAGTGARFRVEVDGVNLTQSVTLPNTGGWEVWQTLTVPIPLSLSQGQHVIRLVMVGSNVENAGVGNYAHLIFE
jgi:hypothetical protein